MSVHICCEGPLCNHGIGAAEREAVHATMPATALDIARANTSRTLAVTPHRSAGTNGRGGYLYACDACGFERVYGNSESHYMFTHERR